MRDLVTVHRRLLEHLGVERPLAAIGGSVGGMQVLQWSIDHPDDLGAGLVICASARLTAQNIAFSAVARAAIMEDENFHGGDYYEHGVRPDNGLSLARRIAHITYLSEESMRAKFGRRLQHDGEPLRGFGIDFAVESYLEYQGESFVNRFDANSYLYLTRVMDYFDPLGDVAPAFEQLRGSRTRFLVLSFDTDWRFPTEHSREIVRVLTARARPGHVPRDLVAARPRLVPPARAGVPPHRRDLHRAHAARGLRMRPDLEVVAGMVPAGSRVLDLGCGDGALLAHLIAERGCDGYGIEIDGDDVLACIAAGVPVSEGDIEDALRDFADGAFDVVLLSWTLQTTRRPAAVVAGMMRVAPVGIVSFPNFAHWRLRAALALRGRMPHSRTLPQAWHETPNIHMCTLADFEALAASLDLRVSERVLLGETRGRAGAAAAALPNLLAAAAVCRLERGAGRARRLASRVSPSWRRRRRSRRGASPARPGP